ncbi:hypothetical protein ACEQPO_27680 [Bacillus sp. SL00103]
MSKTVIVSGARTPFGKLGGALSGLTAAELGGVAIKGARWKEVPEFIMWMRSSWEVFCREDKDRFFKAKAARHADLPWSVPTQTINKSLCIRNAQCRHNRSNHPSWRRGGHHVGGMESMSHAPYLLKKRAGATKWEMVRYKMR